MLYLPIKISALMDLTALSCLDALITAIENKAKKLKGTIKTGRTHFNAHRFQKN